MIQVIYRIHKKPPQWEPRELLIMLVTGTFYLYYQIEHGLSDTTCTEELFKWFGF